MPNEKVLLVEDSAPMRMIVEATLGPICELESVESLSQAREALAKNEYALLLLDVGLPDGDGFEFCRSVRSDSRFAALPIIFLTGESDVERRVLGFEMGADDYVTKPFEPKEFRARVRARINRTQAEAKGTALSFGNFSVDLTRQKAFLKIEGSLRELSLTPIEFKLLVQFLRHQGQVFSREELLTVVWGNAVHVSGHTVDTHISSLRKKVGNYSYCFKAVVKKGYCFTFEAKPTRIAS